MIHNQYDTAKKKVLMCGRNERCLTNFDSENMKEEIKVKRKVVLVLN
jgi:hypothetical protein